MKPPSRLDMLVFRPMASCSSEMSEGVVDGNIHTRGSSRQTSSPIVRNGGRKLVLENSPTPAGLRMAPTP